jgi:hypothetical protein
MFCLSITLNYKVAGNRPLEQQLRPLLSAGGNLTDI